MQQSHRILAWRGRRQNHRQQRTSRRQTGRRQKLHLAFHHPQLGHAICSPAELELYLLDYKEGVEFQIYVGSHRSKTQNPTRELDETRALPHAKVISIESDRPILSYSKTIAQ